MPTTIDNAGTRTVAELANALFEQRIRKAWKHRGHTRPHGSVVVSTEGLDGELPHYGIADELEWELWEAADGEALVGVREHQPAAWEERN